MYSHWKDRTPNFNLNPVYDMPDIPSYKGGKEITARVLKTVKDKGGKKTVVVFDYYHGINEKQFYDEVVSQLNADLLIDTNDAKFPEEEIQKRFGRFITDDRENGVYATCELPEFFDEKIVKELNEKVSKADGLVVVYGVGAQVVVNGDILVYVEIDQEEVLDRFNNGMDNWGAGNYDEDPLKKAKRENFLEERVQFWHRYDIIKDIDLWVDGNKEEFVMLDGDDYREVIDRFTKRPFQLLPIFRPGVWGGDWCQKVLGAHPEWKNIAWGLTGMLDKMSVQANCSGNVVRIPGKELEFYRPIETLGRQIFSMWGFWNPCTLDFLDTMNGQNLSLQVHPTNEYANRHFNYQYTHNESYYMLDTTDSSSVYLGVKNGVKKDELVEAFRKGQEEGKFDDSKWINNWPMKTHDHIFIPCGTIHASGANTLVLEINTTWTSTFKLWDWGRLGLDGKPRPINIEHGSHVIQDAYDTDFTADRLISKKNVVDRGNGWVKERSGLMEYEPLRVDRYWTTEPISIESRDHIKTICVVDGEEAIIESPTGAFEPMPIHYAEAIIVPAAVGRFTVRPYGRSEGKKIAFLECYSYLGDHY